MPNKTIRPIEACAPCHHDPLRKVFQDDSYQLSSVASARMDIFKQLSLKVLKRT